MSAIESPKLIIELKRLHDDTRAVAFASETNEIITRIIEISRLLVFTQGGEEEAIRRMKRLGNALWPLYKTWLCLPNVTTAGPC